MSRVPGSTPDRTEPHSGTFVPEARANSQIRPTASGKAHSDARIIVDDRSSETPPPVSERRLRYEPGTLIDEKYRLTRPIGAGGMGEVWVARHLALDVDVAVKFIGSEEGDEEGLAERLLEEARTTARLGHPSIVRALDFGHTGLGRPFIVLELLDGEDLATLLDREGAIAPARAVALLLPIAHALSVVHENGVVHRDVKPENVFLARAETGILPKLLDFGIARRQNRLARRTARDTALGTPDYMSPEQARGDGAAAATDQWSFGVVLYETVTGTRPFEADNYNALLRTIIEQQPKSLLERGVLEPELWSVLSRTLQKEPADRYATMRELGEALARWLLSRGIGEDAAGTSLKRLWLPDEAVVQELPGDALPTPVPSEPIEAEAPPSAPAAPPHEHDGQISEPEVALAAIAELHRGGEPEERFRRAAQRRAVLTFALLVAFVFAVTLGILVGTGIIEL